MSNLAALCIAESQLPPAFNPDNFLVIYDVIAVALEQK